MLEEGSEEAGVPGSGPGRVCEQRGTRRDPTGMAFPPLCFTARNITRAPRTHGPYLISFLGCGSPTMESTGDEVCGLCPWIPRGEERVTHVVWAWGMAGHR